MAVQHEIPTVDVSPYLDPSAPESARNDVVAQVKAACEQYGFFQLVGHGIPIELQRRALDCAKTFFALPQEQKDVLAMSNAMGNSKRGYERIGGQLLDKKPDLKEGFYIGKEVPADHPEAGQFLKGPNQWPDLPKNLLEEPIMEYREELVKLDTLLMQILAEGLDQPPEVMEDFTRDPVANIKLLHYPPQISRDEDQFGAGAHTDFGCLTLLLQQPKLSGLQVFYPPSSEWIPVPAVEDTFVVNVGDLIHSWTGGRYRSALHRVLNDNSTDRYSIPFFFQGNMQARNPFAPGEKSLTVEEHILAMYNKTFIPQKA